MSLLTMRNAVTLAVGNRSDLTSTVNDQINHAVREINRMAYIPEMMASTTFSSAASTHSYAFSTVAADLYAVVAVRDNTNKRILRRGSLREFDRLDRTVTGKPQKWVRFGANIFLYRKVPDAIYTIELKYKKRHALLESDGDALSFPAEWEEGVVILATAKVFRILNEADKWQRDMQDFQRWLSQWDTVWAFEDGQDYDQGLDFGPEL